MTKKTHLIFKIFFILILATSLFGAVRSNPDGEVEINNGAVYTNSTMVTLALDASTIFDDLSTAEMSIDRTENSTWTAWIPYSSTMVYNLLSGDGVKTVYVRFRVISEIIRDIVIYDTAEIFQDSITLDTTPPTLQITNPVENGLEINSSTLQVSWTAEDTGSGLDYVNVVDHNGNVVNVGTDTTYAVTGLSNGNYVFGVEAFDNAGNSRTASVDFTVNITAAPSPPPEETETTESSSNLWGGGSWIYVVAVGAIAGAATIGGVMFYRNRRVPRSPAGEDVPQYSESDVDNTRAESNKSMGGADELKVPSFSLQAENMIVPPWPSQDPPTDIYRLVDKSRLARLVKEEIRYKQAVLKARQDYYFAVNDIIKDLK